MYGHTHHRLKSHLVPSMGIAHGLCLPYFVLTSTSSIHTANDHHPGAPVCSLGNILTIPIRRCRCKYLYSHSAILRLFTSGAARRMGPRIYTHVLFYFHRRLSSSPFIVRVKHILRHVRCIQDGLCACSVISQISSRALHLAMIRRLSINQSSGQS